MIGNGVRDGTRGGCPRGRTDFREMSQKELFFSAPLSPSPTASSSTYLFQGTMLQGVLASKVEKSSVAFIERHMGIGTALNLPPHEPLPVMSQWDGQDNANISDNDR